MTTVHGKLREAERDLSNLSRENAALKEKVSGSVTFEMYERDLRESMAERNKLEAIVAEQAEVIQTAAEMIRRSDHTPARSLLLTADTSHIRKERDQLVADACANFVRSGDHDDDPYIIANRLNEGEWKEHL